MKKNKPQLIRNLGESLYICPVGNALVRAFLFGDTFCRPVTVATIAVQKQQTNEDG